MNNNVVIQGKRKYMIIHNREYMVYYPASSSPFHAQNLRVYERTFWPRCEANGEAGQTGKTLGLKACCPCPEGCRVGRSRPKETAVSPLNPVAGHPDEVVTGVAYTHDCDNLVTQFGSRVLDQICPRPVCVGV